MKFGFERPRKPASAEDHGEAIAKKSSKVGKFTRAAALGSLVSMGPAQQDSVDSVALVKFNNRQVAAEQLESSGITKEREIARGMLSASLERGLSPFKYSEVSEGGERRNLGADLLRIMTGIAVGTVRDENGDKKNQLVQEIQNRYSLSSEAADSFYESRMDAFRLYLGLPQRHGTFGISEYKPSKSVQDKFYYKINNFLQNFENVVPKLQGGSDINDTLREREVLRWLWINAQNGYDAEFPTEDVASGVMGRYTLTRGEDEKGKYVSYYDLWDLGGSIEGLSKDGVAGKPFEIYDRIYIHDPVVTEEKTPNITLISTDAHQ